MAGLYYSAGILAGRASASFVVPLCTIFIRIVEGAGNIGKDHTLAPAPRLSTHPLTCAVSYILPLSIVIRICFPRLDLQYKFLYIQSPKPRIFLFLVFYYSTKSSSARINRISSLQYDSPTYPSRRARHCWPNLHVRQVPRD